MITNPTVFILGAGASKPYGFPTGMGLKNEILKILGKSLAKNLQRAKLEKNNLTHLYTNFKHPTYNQQFEPFIPNMSVIDLLFNHGSKTSREIIQKSGKIGKLRMESCLLKENLKMLMSYLM
ncbi:MAG: WbqC family protein [Candidatus Dadabacteria bacterium]|nr:WbqC family protein [Candidatus Dadabacteria bacterium]